MVHFNIKNLLLLLFTLQSNCFIINNYNNLKIVNNNNKQNNKTKINNDKKGKKVNK